YYRGTTHPTTAEHPWDNGESSVTRTGASTILMVGAIESADGHLARALAADGDTVVQVDTVAEALEELQSRAADAVLIHDSNEEPYTDLINLLRTTAPGCSVRFYKDLPSLVLEDTEDTDELAHILASNLHLFSAVLASKQGMSVDAGVRIGPLADRVCIRLGLSTRDRLVIVSAAYLQDLAHLYFDGSSMMDNESRLFMLLSSAGEGLIFSPSVVAVTRAIGRKLETTNAENIPFPTLGGNIISVVSFYCRMFPWDTRLTPHQFEVVTENLRSRIDRDFLQEVVELFLDILYDDIVGPADQRLACQVMILNQLHDDDAMLRGKLLGMGFSCTVVDSTDECVFRFEQNRPDMLLIAQSGDPHRAIDVVEELVRRGIRVQEVPTFGLVQETSAAVESQLLRLGIEDVVVAQDNLDVLMVKIQRVHTAQEKESRQRLNVLQDMGTHGSLSHMNVIDLLQAMGHGEKTVRISVSAEGNQLTMYLGQGKLLYAECNQLVGAEAVFEALAWSRGIWSVDQVGDEELPNSNIYRTIDSILIEGVHRVDEKKHSESQGIEQEAIDAALQSDELASSIDAALTPEEHGESSGDGQNSQDKQDDRDDQDESASSTQSIRITGQ
ncbi:DUF4388 domain-containing protein, partial [candidate division GN15 bacterium]|nr:DUF4388 domain-containing protein [candidate division GN15 bacterium]